MKRKTIDIITLGCSKNLVDSEHLMRQLEEAGYHVTHDTEKPEGEIAVINTCGFIGDAKEESINMILEFAQAKEEGDLEKLYVMGCLSERYLKELAIEIPQVDKFYGKFNWVELLQDLGKAYHEEFHIERTLTTPKHYAYLKISEGCDRKCSYCAIPIITGKHVSRPMEEILDEVRYLVNKGVKEFQVIAQELTYYGVDFDFEELKEFIRKARFDRMGAFTYSEEEGTYAAAHYEDEIPQEVKQARLDELMSIQQGISAEQSAAKVGQCLKVIIDRLEGDYYIGRTEFDSPEVDPEVLIEQGKQKLLIGNFYQVEIINSDDFDLFGRVI